MIIEVAMIFVAAPALGFCVVYAFAAWRCRQLRWWMTWEALTYMFVVVYQWVPLSSIQALCLLAAVPAWWLAVFLIASDDKAVPA